MFSLELKNVKDVENNDKLTPISIIKGDDRNNYYNNFLCINKDEKAKNKNKKIDLPPDLMYQLMPPIDKNKRSIWYIAGASGSGKSFQAKLIIQNYKKLFPTRNIFLISKLESDETLDALKYIKRVDLNLFCEEEFDVNKAKPSLIIFDDFETLEKKQLETVLKAVDDIAIMGRHLNISMIYISHNLTNYKQTRLILNESHNIIIFPQSTSFHQLKYLLQNYGNMDKEQVKQLRKLGRWCSIHTQFPNYVISDSSAYLLHQD